MTGDDDTGEAMAPAELEPAGAAVPVEAKAVATGAAKPAPRRVAPGPHPARHRRRLPRAEPQVPRSGRRAPVTSNDAGDRRRRHGPEGFGAGRGRQARRGPRPCADALPVRTQGLRQRAGCARRALPDFDRVSVGFNGVVRKGPCADSAALRDSIGGPRSASGTQVVGCMDRLRSRCRVVGEFRPSGPHLKMTQTSRVWR